MVVRMKKLLKAGAIKDLKMFFESRIVIVFHPFSNKLQNSQVCTYINLKAPFNFVIISDIEATTLKFRKEHQSGETMLVFKKVSNFTLSVELNLGDYSKGVCFMRYILVVIWKVNLTNCGHLANFEKFAEFGYITKSFLETVKLQILVSNFPSPQNI